MKERKVKDLITQGIADYLKGHIPQEMPVGYNPIEKIRGALFSWVKVPFNGVDVFCQLRCPNATQLEQCGDISNITLDQENPDHKFEYEDIIKIRNYQEAICKIVFNVPTFDHITTLAKNNDFVISEKKAELAALEKRFDENKDEMTETERSVIEKEIQTINLQIGFILPDDTMAFVTKWAMGNDVSDIKKITKESLLRAACLAKNNNKAPSDYLSGVYTDYNKKEIDAYAGHVLQEFLKDQETFRGAKYQWYLGGKNKQKASSDELPKR